MPVRVNQFFHFAILIWLLLDRNQAARAQYVTLGSFEDSCANIFVSNCGGYPAFPYSPPNRYVEHRPCFSLSTYGGSLNMYYKGCNSILTTNKIDQNFPDGNKAFGLSHMWTHTVTTASPFPSSAVFLPFSAPLSANANYLLTYFDFTPDSAAQKPARYDSLRVAVSAINADFGQEVSISVPRKDKWTKRMAFFKPQVAVGYLAVGTQNNLLPRVYSMAYIDHFQLFKMTGENKVFKVLCVGDSVKLSASITGKRYDWSTHPEKCETIGPTTVNGDSIGEIWVKDSGWYWSVAYLPNKTFVLDSFRIELAINVMGGKHMNNWICSDTGGILAAPNTPGFTKWLWSTGDTVPQTRILAPGWYTLRMSTGSSCFRQDSFFVQKYTYNRTDALHDTTLCHFLPVTLSLSPQLLSYAHLWSTGQTTVFGTATGPGIYTCSTQIGGCVRMDTFIVKRVAPPQIDLPPDTFFCSGSTLFLDASTPGYSSYVWEDGRSGAIRTVTAEGIYVIAAADTLCSDTAIVIVKEQPIPELHLPHDEIFCPEEIEGVVLDAGDFATYSWHPTGEITRTIFARKAEIYRVEVGDEWGCRNRDTILVDTACDARTIFIPNAFTPDNDGTNDRFLPVFSGMKAVHLRVYNRWGQEVYKESPVNTGWNGMVDRDFAPADVYVYRVEYEDKAGRAGTLKGSVTLLR